MQFIFQKYSIFIIFVCEIYLSQSQKRIGDVCNLPIRGKGVCQKAGLCPSAVRQRQAGLSYSICSNGSGGLVICCQDVPTRRPKTTTTSTTENPNLRASERKCREYSKLVQRETEDQPGLRKTFAQCSFTGEPSIYFGVKTAEGEFPHMALLGYGSKPDWACGGSLISERYVLTAAHCLFTRLGDVKKVKLGKLSIFEGSPAEDFDVEQLIKHPNYRRTPIYNDIGLIRLSRDVIFDFTQRPACLWTKPYITEETTIATGWGITEEDTRSNYLLKVGLNIIDNNKCKQEYKSKLYRMDRRLPEITNDLICAINSSSSGDTCQGDSGGPIQIKDAENNCIYYIIGITAAGKGCGTSLPSIYMRVSSYIDWIENIVWL